MTDPLLPYYNRELSFLRKLGAEFAEAHPKIAGRLRWGTDVAEDPHVARMIEGFAYLTARIRHKLDDDFPELAEAMLGVLYPHYLAPIPSMSIGQFELDRHRGDAGVQRRPSHRLPVDAFVRRGQQQRHERLGVRERLHFQRHADPDPRALDLRGARRARGSVRRDDPSSPQGEDLIRGYTRLVHRLLLAQRAFSFRIATSRRWAIALPPA